MDDFDLILAEMQKMNLDGVIVDNADDADDVKDKRICRNCNVDLVCSSNDLEFNCPECGYVVSLDANEISTAQASSYVSNIRIVGKGSGLLQKGLYRGGGLSAAHQERNIYDEYLLHSREYEQSENGRAIPNVALSLAAQYYSTVQQSYVKRSNNKKTIMAACLSLACLKYGIFLSKDELSEIMKTKSSISYGYNFLGALISSGQMSKDITVDQTMPEIRTMLAKLDIESEVLTDMVIEFLDICKAKKICIDSQLTSRIAAIIYNICRRSKELNKFESLDDFCIKIQTKRNTIQKIFNGFGSYNSRFVDFYIRHDLFSGVIN